MNSDPHAIFSWIGFSYYSEQEIIDAGVRVIYKYCRNVKGRWRKIEPLMIKSGFYGYVYARDVIKGKYDKSLNQLYLSSHNYSEWIQLYREHCI